MSETKTENEIREENLLAVHGEKVSEAIVEASVPDDKTIEYDGVQVKVLEHRFEGVLGDEQHDYATEVDGKRMFLFWDDNVFCVENVERVKNSLQKIATMGQRVGVYSETNQERSVKEMVKATDFILRFFDEHSKSMIQNVIEDDDVFDETVLYSIFMGAIVHVVSGFPLD